MNKIKFMSSGLKELVKIAQEFEERGFLDEKNQVVDVAKSVIDQFGMHLKEDTDIPPGLETGGFFTDFEIEEERITKIIDSLYIGSKISDENDMQNVRDLGISVVVDLIANNILVDLIFDGEFVLSLKVGKNQPFSIDSLKMLVEFIKNSIYLRKKILIQCERGRARAASLAAAYLVKEEGYSSEQAFRYIRKQRKNIEPNPEQIAAIVAYEDLIGGKKFRG